MDTSFQDAFNALRREALETYYGRMNDMQKRAVFQVDGPLLILAGAGSGKTTVLINRIENMVRFGNAYHSSEVPDRVTDDTMDFLRDYIDGTDDDHDRLAAELKYYPIKPWNVLAITFTNKAAGELRQRLSDKLGDAALDIQASTFHSLCVRILRRDIEHLGYSRSFTIYDTDDSVRVIKECLRSARLDEKMFVPKAVLGVISKAKDAMMTPKRMLDEAGSDYRMAGIARVYEAYQAALKTANALDFDDIIVLTVRLFQQFPEVLSHYQNRYKYIMVDEYQDTNHAQYLLISLLAAAHKNLCVVGDDDQSIYKFRGATIENILSFEEQFPGALVIRLEQNYRSTQPILSAANKVIENNTARKGKNLWTDAGDGDKVRIIRLRDEVEEGRLLTDTILDNVKNGAKFSDHVVLYRMNAQSNTVEKSLAKNAIPYRIVGGVRFYERKEIKDMVAYLSVLSNRGDNLRLLRIINEPKRGIGGSTLGAAQEIAEQLGLRLFEVIATADQYAPLSKKSTPLLNFAALMNRLADIADTRPLDELLDTLLEETGYLRMLEAQGFEGVGRIENIMELKSNVVKYTQESEEPSLTGFLEEIALYTDLDNYDASTDAVVLMTIHSAKGLEFDHVFIVGMDEGIFPGKSAMNFPEEIEEERRLAYVAITRAKRRLTITGAQRRLIFGQTIWSRPSRFTAEIPEELVELEDKTLVQKKEGASTYQTRRKGGGTASSTTIGVGAHDPAGATEAVRVGETVEHKVFGPGKVLTAKPMAGDTLLEIEFDRVGVKKVMANFARLTKL